MEFHLYSLQGLITLSHQLILFADAENQKI
jgi:hypothetical protein